MKMMRMYKNFTLDEFVRSDTARSRGIDNTPPDEAIAHLGELVGVILQPLRDAWGKPINVTSGYRCSELNKAVGGSGNSAHLYGYAADIQPADMKSFPLFTDFIQSFVTGRHIPFDQIIIEQSTSSKWIHIAVRNRNGEQRGQLFGMRV